MCVRRGECVSVGRGECMSVGRGECVSVGRDEWGVCGLWRSREYRRGECVSAGMWVAVSAWVLIAVRA